MIDLPLVMAKVTYALHLYEEKHEDEFKFTNKALRQLMRMSRGNTNKGHTFWSVDPLETKHGRKLPVWYHRGAKASSIEATAYALMVILRHQGSNNRVNVNVDGVADWLVNQRNEHGAFIGAMDSAAAIQALSHYSSTKQQQLGGQLDLESNVVFGQRHEYQHRFKFVYHNATSVQSVEDVPVGNVLEVSTKGQGLGQMQVNVEYNVPIDKNEHCKFNITIEKKERENEWREDHNKDNPLCRYCNYGCQAAPPPPPANSLPSDGFHTWGRGKRSTRSKKAMCLNLCIQHKNKTEESGPVVVEIDMLTGFWPVDFDVQQLKAIPGVRQAEFLHTEEKLLVTLSGVSGTLPTCLGLRAVDMEEVGRPTPASVFVRELEEPEPTCTEKYESPLNQQSLQVFCADISHQNRGECRCYSGQCSTCQPLSGNSARRVVVSDLDDMASCSKDQIIYQAQLLDWKSSNQWVEIEADVLAINRTSKVHKVRPGQNISLITPASCFCPTRNYVPRGDPFYLMSREPSKLMDRYGNERYRYLLDHQTNILRTSEPKDEFLMVSRSGKPAVPFFKLKLSAISQPQC